MLAEIFNEVSQQLSESINAKVQENNAKLFSKELVKSASISEPLV
ncbi:hypothetical protein [Leuconostoc lactis]